jgi:hypothetical protein
MIAQLIPENGGEPISIDRDVVVLGRQEEGCDVTIEHKSVSKIHCVIVKTDGLLFVRDLLSTNGTRVNGQRSQFGQSGAGCHQCDTGHGFDESCETFPGPPLRRRSSPSSPFRARELRKEEASRAGLRGPQQEAGLRRGQDHAVLQTFLLEDGEIPEKIAQPETLHSFPGEDDDI